MPELRSRLVSAKLPDEVVIDLTQGTVTFDGEPFPWHIALDGIEVPTETECMPTVVLTIPADKVVVK